MKYSIKQELAEHILDAINFEFISEYSPEDWHQEIFNRDYYLVGYHACEKWLQAHGVSPFEAIATCQQYEEENFGECSKKYDNAETTVNMLVYIYGEEFLNEANCETVEELKDYCEEVAE